MLANRLPALALTAIRVTLTSAALVVFASAAELAAPEKAGLAVGQKAPAFALKDQDGRDVKLEALLKENPVALVFYRSADW